LVSFGSNSLWAALVAIFLVRFGNHFSGRLWQQYFGKIRQRFCLGSFSQQYSGETRQQFFSNQLWQQYSGELRHQFSLGICGNNIWCDNNLPGVEIIYLAW
jgi:hypothetical protein